MALLLEPIRFLLSLTPLSRCLPRTDHFAPHPTVPFEGYYTRIVTSTNSTILLILSSVRSAPAKPHFIHFSHIPAAAPPDLRIDLFPAIVRDIPGTRRPSGFQEFICTADALGHYHTAEHTQTYSLRLPDPDRHGAVVEVDITLTQRTPWHANDPLSTPEGIFAGLTRLLPLHWNVFSHRSTAHYSIRRDGAVWRSGIGTAHVEKNWGASFPHGWIWFVFLPSLAGSLAHSLTIRRMQGFAETASFCLAGGQILGQKAFLIAYRSQLHACSFAPPTTLLPFAMSVSPFLAVRHCSRDGTLGIIAYNVFRTVKLVVDAVAPSVCFPVVCV